MALETSGNRDRASQGSATASIAEISLFANCHTGIDSASVTGDVPLNDNATNNPQVVDLSGKGNN